MSGNSSVVLVCRDANEQPMTPGSKGGYHCATCGKEVAVTERGRAQLEVFPEAIILCNPCGFKMANELGSKEKLGGVVINPAAQDQLKRWEAEDGDGPKGN